MVDRFFKYLNAFPIPLWLAMMVAPNHPWTKRAARSGTVFGVAAIHYMITLLHVLRRSARGETRLDFTTLEGVRAGLAKPEGTLAAWSHMLALDLFTGAWIYRQCQRLGAPAWVRIPALFFTLMTGPFGLLIFLLWRGLAPSNRIGDIDKSDFDVEPVLDDLGQGL